MQKHDRHEFNSKTKATLAERVAYRCSYPGCKIVTVAPSENDNKSSKFGIACHICAAAPGGPRYDKNMSKEERKSINNGIWLCSQHAKFIDDNPAFCTTEILKEWKKDTEKQVLNAALGGFAGDLLPELSSMLMKKLDNINATDLFLLYEEDNRLIAVNGTFSNIIISNYNTSIEVECSIDQTSKPPQKNACSKVHARVTLLPLIRLVEKNLTQGESLKWFKLSFQRTGNHEFCIEEEVDTNTSRYGPHTVELIDSKTTWGHRYTVYDEDGDVDPATSEYMNSIAKALDQISNILTRQKRLNSQ